MLILNIIDNVLASYYGVCRVLIMIYYRFARILFLKIGLFYLRYYIWYIEFIEKYYFLCVKKTIAQINRNMCLLICRLFAMVYLSVQNILFYN